MLGFHDAVLSTGRKCHCYEVPCITEFHTAVPLSADHLTAGQSVSFMQKIQHAALYTVCTTPARRESHCRCAGLTLVRPLTTHFCTTAQFLNAFGAHSVFAAPQHCSIEIFLYRQFLYDMLIGLGSPSQHTIARICCVKSCSHDRLLCPASSSFTLLCCNNKAHGFPYPGSASLALGIRGVPNMLACKMLQVPMTAAKQNSSFASAHVTSAGESLAKLATANG